MAAGLGSALYDMMDPVYITECWLTFLMKGAYAVAAGLVAKKLKCGEYLKDLIATTAGATTYAVLYLGKSFLKTWLVGGTTVDAAFLALGLKVPATIFNMAVAILIAPVLTTAIRKALEQNHISLN